MWAYGGYGVRFYFLEHTATSVTLLSIVNSHHLCLLRNTNLGVPLHNLVLLRIQEIHVRMPYRPLRLLQRFSERDFLFVRVDVSIAWGRLIQGAGQDLEDILASRGRTCCSRFGFLRRVWLLEELRHLNDEIE